MTLVAWLGVTALVVSIALAIRLVARRTPALGPILGAAFGLRLAAALVHRFGTPLPDSGADAVSFERIGWEWAQMGWGALGGNFGLGSTLYTWTVSVVYLVFGREALLLQTLNVAMGTGVVALAYLAASHLWNGSAARMTGWFVALWPSLILYSAIPLREAFFTFGLALATLGAVLWIARGSTRGFLLAFAGAGIATAYHGAGVVALLALILASVASVVRALVTARPSLPRRALELGGLAAALAAAWVVADEPLDHVGGASMFTVETISARMALAQNADSGYLESLRADSWFDVAWQTPLRMAYFLFSPMVWDIEKASYLVGFFDAVLYLVVIISLARASPRLRKVPAAWFVAGLALLLLVALALNTLNAGTALRHRAKLAPLLLVLVTAAPFVRPATTRTRRLLIFTNDPAVFFPNRHALAQAAKAKRWDVHVAGPPGAGAEAVRKAGWTFHEVPLDRRNLAPWREFPTLVSTWRTLRRVRPDVVHAFALKPILHAGLASRFTRVRGIVATVTGLGYLFLDRRPLSAGARAVLGVALGIALDHPRCVVVFQNPDDRAVFAQLGIVPEPQTMLVRGSGVDLDQYKPAPEPAGPPLVVLAGRMLRDKGVREFVEAARLLRREGVEARFALVGDVDPQNPASIEREELEAWTQEGDVEWWGHRNDMREVFAASHIVCLPSYGEGVPRVLLEGAAIGRPLVASDVPGCREVCLHEETGLLVSARDAPALATALHRLLADPALRVKLGQGARRRVETTFARSIVESEQLALYARLAARTP